MKGKAIYKIEYNNDKKRVIEFILEDSDRPDKLLVYEQGNKITSADQAQAWSHHMTTEEYNNLEVES